jgi:hypothetical protein
MASIKVCIPDMREQQIHTALKAITNGLEGGVAAAAERFGVPCTTLYYRLTGTRQSQQTSHDSQQRLTAAEEKGIVQ